MGQYEQHVFVCTSGETCPEQGDTEKFVKILRERAKQAGRPGDVRINKAGCFSQCGRGPMIVFYPDDVWYAGVQESDLEEIFRSHIVGGRPVELKNIHWPALLIAAERDHITPLTTTLPLFDHISSKQKDKLIIPAGHVGLVAGRGAVNGLWPKVSEWLAAHSG